MKNCLNLCLEAKTFAVIAILLPAIGIAEAGESELPRCRTDIEPTLRVTPIYPTDVRVATDANEVRVVGWVVVEFTILETGRTDNRVVVESNSMIFHHSAKQAISKYRYSPQENACVHRVRMTYQIE